MTHISFFTTAMTLITLWLVFETCTCYDFRFTLWFLCIAVQQQQPVILLLLLQHWQWLVVVIFFIYNLYKKALIDLNDQQLLTRQTDIWLVVSVPVLSEQITEVHPSVCTDGKLRTIAFFFAIRLVPRARHVVMTAGRPSGMAATASTTAICIVHCDSLSK